MSEERAPSFPALGAGVTVGNPGNPILLSGLQLDGVAAETGQPGTAIQIWSRASFTSDEGAFHCIAKSLADHIEFRASEAGSSASLAGTDMTLLIIRPDNSGELWLDAAAFCISAVLKRPVEAGVAVFDSDIADITGLYFPSVQIGEEDRLVCLFREKWRFALFFDFNPNRRFSLPDMMRDLGTLYRRLRYSDVYDALANSSILDALIRAGWFPFVEIIGGEFDKLRVNCQNGFDLDVVETELVTQFDAIRLEHMFTRWMSKPHFAGRERLLRSAVRAYLASDPVAVLKIVLTEIEGILNEAHRQKHGTWAKQDALLAFAVHSAEEKQGHPETLMFPSSFRRYLADYTFANFDRNQRVGNAGSRHAVCHGAAESDSYTQTRALQALLTLDQLAFFT